MGLLLSILVGCVGVLELLSCLKKVTSEVSAASVGPTSPCLSYHETTDDIPSFHDSLCSVSHSGDIPVSGSAKRKLENLHEYSLRVRSELKSAGGSERGTLSECSTRDILSPSRTDSRHSLANLDSMIVDDQEQDDEEEDDAWRSLLSVLPSQRTFGILVEDHSNIDQFERCTIEEIQDVTEARESLLPGGRIDQYVRVPTPIPIGISQELSPSDSSLSSSAESGNEAPTRLSLDQVSGLLRLGGHGDENTSSSRESIIREDDPTGRSSKKDARVSRLSEPKRRLPIVIGNSPKSEAGKEKSAGPLASNEEPTRPDVTETSCVLDAAAKSVEGPQRRGRSDRTKAQSAVLRKPTRLKSRNAETSKSAENLAIDKSKRTKRQREPERRKSDISVQTIEREESLRDEWTNTSPTNSEVSLADSRTSVSVQVQTSFDEQPGDFAILENPPLGLSESARDIGLKDSDGRRAFRNRRFAGSNAPKSRSLDDYPNSHWIVGDVEALGYARNIGARWDPKRLEANGVLLADRDSRTRTEERADKEEESSMDEEFVDAEEASTSVSADGPIEYRIPSNEASGDKPFWVTSSPFDERLS